MRLLSTRSLTYVLAPVAVVLSAAACASASAAGGDDGGTPYIVRPTQEPDAYMEALIHGEIAVQGGCFVLLGGEKPSLVSWPYGTERSTEADDAVVVPPGVTVRAGDTVEAGGGEWPRNRHEEYNDRCDLEGVGELVQLNPGLRVVADS
ncbi:hypothetical protein [Myceligenerans pegani]|uniref:Lipoprotein n=1 Tax=Myceligenerans pegani TaxID=2776917 RepID=A0ABR9N324_9MICO|nr:hypothetical protein [Myceligenerans sp. TRM 65318]MBE1878052.1 hypothetical protein [Myceligenerans sp. TRM 65318]MBE3020323.1 hypothetical protein [Myceligenerans sp. TRM 65318]